MPKRQLPVQSDLIINRLGWEAIVDRQREALDVDDDTPHVPSTDPMSNPKAAAHQFMSAKFQSIEEAITASYQSASQVETMARQLEARISKIDGAKRHLPHRNYGQPVDLGKIRSNLTLTALIAQDSAELAHFCGIDPGIRHRIDEEKEARAMAAQSL